MNGIVIGVYEWIIWNENREIEEWERCQNRMIDRDCCRVYVIWLSVRDDRIVWIEWRGVETGVSSIE